MIFSLQLIVAFVVNKQLLTMTVLLMTEGTIPRGTRKMLIKEMVTNALLVVSTLFGSTYK